MKSQLWLELSKSERARLRSLAEQAWEAELDKALTDLFEDFRSWSNSEMSGFDLSDRIHQFHQGISRELYSRYTALGPELLVSRAVALGFLDASTLGERLAEKLAPRIESFRSLGDAP
ncbi:hypothetical protein [Dokdonella immobilis]|uniref:Uncharacterized protein n=1 Tax=Dokdonella immobilis TaxID=578942 RepID=A0A1I4YHI4_9GAMM|nr:hypothetical protein [Dokdonella immobilis]SFN37501.1 hypothetical protein SAMN05216289_11779 [Dokdonella immobilis]